ncbi:MAG TPA: cytochrome c3 family protein, partial [Candidatus Binatia bacterium]|nr:cytochrome c3 family protein [Candidatus Binatia bacterium]
LPTDQFDKYKESRHGMTLLTGKNPRAAECTSCHGVHGIQGPSSPESHVYPLNVPATCGACHADAEVMAGVTLPDGSPIPTDQYEKYRDSVHGRALLENGDIGAPACNDCHGNHAAMPPEIANVAQVCRTCHANNGALFDGSAHKKAFDKNGWPECGACHGEHAVEKLTDDALALEPGGLCVDCHEEHARDNSDCEATAEYFHTQLTGFVRAHEELEHAAEHIARRGLDVEPIELALDSLADTLKQSRSAIHAFDRSQFDTTAAPAREAIDEIHKHVEQSKADFRYRLAGLLVAAAFILVTIVALWLKLRRIESDRS